MDSDLPAVLGLPEADALYAELERGEPATRALTAFCAALAARVEDSRWAVLSWSTGFPVVHATSAALPVTLLDQTRPGAAGRVLRVVRSPAGDDPAVCALHELRGGQGDIVGALAVVLHRDPDTDTYELLARAAGPAAVGARIARAELAVASSSAWSRVEPLGVLAGGIAHEFNNLLTAMSGNLALAQMHTRTSSPAAAYLDALDRSIARAGHLTARMLAFSGRGHVDVRPAQVDVTLDACLPRLKLLLPARGRLRTLIPPGLPQVRLDVPQFHQALSALVANAGEALGPDGGSVHIQAHLTELEAGHAVESWSAQPLPPGPYVRIRVTDDGDGMPPEVAARAFDPFFTTRGPGRGLGLCSVLGVIRGHGAGLRLTSTPGQGTRVDLYFPVRVPPPRTTEPPPADAQLVLIVDDDDMVRETLATMAQRRGLVAVQARDGVEAVDKWHELGPRIALVLLDLVMPRMDGSQTWHALRELGADVPIVLCTGYDDSRSPRPIPYGGLAGTLRKPFNRRAFDEVVDAALRARSE